MEGKARSGLWALWGQGLGQGRHGATPDAPPNVCTAFSMPPSPGAPGRRAAAPSRTGASRWRTWSASLWQSAVVSHVKG